MRKGGSLFDGRAAYRLEQSIGIPFDRNFSHDASVKLTPPAVGCLLRASKKEPFGMERQYKRDRRTKIVATVGPGSASPDMLERLFATGVDIFRLNFSHGSHADHADVIRALRALETRVGRPVCILADLQGPKLRVGTFVEGAVMLDEGRPFRLDLDPAPGDVTRVRLPHPEIISAAREGSTLMLDDGKLVLRVTATGPTHLDTVVLVGGRLSNRKGVNVPDVLLPIPALTEKDRTDLAFALHHGADVIALSFVQRPGDVQEARDIIGNRAWILSKIEKPQALETLEEIIELSDAVMVARGDLGVELPAEDVPLVQKRIVRTARMLGKPVVVATQMLESMISSPTPTRAEASDVATAVFDGGDAVMLSAETAVGKYPTEAVAIMDRIIRRTEHDPAWVTLLRALRPRRENNQVADAIGAAAQQVAETLEAGAIVSYSLSGKSAARIARERPSTPILGLAGTIEAARRLSLVWGVHSIALDQSNQAATMGDAVKRAAVAARNEGFASRGGRIVVVAGVPFGTAGTTNTLRVVTLD
jgi:pyruvate kinase